MDNEIHISLVVLVKLNEVVAATKRSDSPIDTPGIFNLPIAVKFCNKFLRLTVNLHLLADKRFESAFLFTNPHTRRHISAYMLVESMIVNICKFAEIEDTHTAADVNAHNIGYDLVAKVSGKTNHAPCTCVDVGHDAYLLV